MADDDPTAIRSIAVTAGDVLAAFEANRQRDAGAVLRITPPFAGRMRARLHRGPADYDRSPEPIHVAPDRLLSEAAVGSYPTADDTEDDLREHPGETYSPERHREYHESAVADWRSSARDSLVETVTLETPEGPHEVTVKPLG